jgi:hypothetical protein
LATIDSYVRRNLTNAAARVVHGNAGLPLRPSACRENLCAISEGPNTGPLSRFGVFFSCLGSPFGRGLL